MNKYLKYANIINWFIAIIVTIFLVPTWFGYFETYNQSVINIIGSLALLQCILLRFSMRDNEQ